MSEEAKNGIEQENAEQAEQIAASLNDAKPVLSEAKAEEILEPEKKETSAEDYKLVIEDLNDKLLRAMAEAQNTRHRADLDVKKAKSFATQGFAKDLLGVMDNLFRACDTIPDEEAKENPKLHGIKEGIEITKREMINVFERNGIKRIDPMGQPFDANLHQAMSQMPDAEAAPNTIMQVLQVGYTLKDRLLRPALVVVSTKPAGE